MNLVEGHAVAVQFAPTFGNKRLRMMEMSPELLGDVMKEGTVKIKGNPDDEAVLCTNGTTYQVHTAILNKPAFHLI